MNAALDSNAGVGNSLYYSSHLFFYFAAKLQTYFVISKYMQDCFWMAIMKIVTNDSVIFRIVMPLNNAIIYIYIYNEIYS